MKEIVLHIGTEKTATTSIQSFFSVNQDRVLDAGIWYPCSENLDYCHRNAHFPLAASLYEECPDFVVPRKYFKPDILFNKLFHDFDSRDEKTLLLSAEHFSSRCSRPERVAALGKILKRYQVKIVVYIRPQHELLLSAYSTFLQSGGKKSLDEVARQQWLRPQAIYFNYLKMIERWWGIFGENSVTVRVFQENRFYGGNVYKDLVSILGLEWDASFEIPDRQNTTICKELADFLYLANQHFPNFNEDDRPGWELGQAFRSEVAPLFPQGQPLERLLSSELKADTTNFFSEYNEELARIARPDLTDGLFLNVKPDEISTKTQSDNHFSKEFVSWVVQQWRDGRPILSKLHSALG
jgi:hypothetical protein